MGDNIVKDWANTWIRAFKEIGSFTNLPEDGWSKVNKQVKCEDGFEFSMQAGPSMYSDPRAIADHYNSVEIGFPNEPEPLLKEFAEDPDNLSDTVYGWVPVARVNEIIEKHGGICEKQFVLNKLKDDRSYRSKTQDQI